jgi:hypothetical protein
MKTTDRIRSWIKNQNRDFRLADLAEAMPDLQSTKIRKGVDQLIKAQEIEAIERGKYRARKPITLSEIGKFKLRILKAMHIKGVFSVSEIVHLTDADKTQVMHFIKKFSLCKQVSECGQRKKHTGHLERVFRVCNRDDFYLKNILNETKI